MDPIYLLACGIVWRKTGDEGAGRELIVALSDHDVNIRFLSERLLVAAGPVSLRLLESAVASGELDRLAGAQCILEVLNGCATYAPMSDSRDRELLGAN
jgi:hypothetical protein